MGNILLSSAGRRVALCNIIKKELKQLNIDAQVITADCEPEWSPACYVADMQLKAPAVSSESFIDQMLSYCKEHNIRVVIPTLDHELQLYADAIELFRKIGTTVVVSSSGAVSLFWDKNKSNQFFDEIGVPTPSSYLLKDFTIDPLTRLEGYIAKPIDGSCSSGLIMNLMPEHLDELDKETTLIQEKLLGNEYTVNCFIDFSGELISVTPHRRITVRSGEVCFAQTEYLPVFEDIAKKLAQAEVGLRGAFCFQGFIKEEPHPRSLFGIRNLAGFRGGQINAMAAEAFYLIREFQ